MSAHRAVFPIKTMARVFKVCALGYYASARATADLGLTRKIRTLYATPRMSYRELPIHAELRGDGLQSARSVRPT